MTALQHLLEGDPFLVAVRQRLPRLVGLVVQTEFDHLLDLIVAQLIAAGHKLTDGPRDAFLLIHLRDQFALIGFGVGRTEDLPYHILTQTDPREPQSALHTGLFGQACLTAVVGERHHEGLIGITLGMGLDGVLKTGIELRPQPFALVALGT